MTMFLAREISDKVCLRETIHTQILFLALILNRISQIFLEINFEANQNPLFSRTLENMHINEIIRWHYPEMYIS